jgi:tripartite-type tricarboxylate transporter receptor subunit TctC
LSNSRHRHDVRFLSGVPAALDLSGGRISVIIESLAAFASAVQGATVKLLAVADKRLPEFPDVAAVAKDPAGT